MSTDSVDQRRGAGTIDLPAEVTEMDVDEVTELIALRFPHTFGELRTRDDLARMAHENFEDRVLPWGQADRNARPRDTVAQWIQREIGD